MRQQTSASTVLMIIIGMLILAGVIVLIAMNLQEPVAVTEPFTEVQQELQTDQQEPEQTLQVSTIVESVDGYYAVHALSDSNAETIDGIVREDLYAGRELIVEGIDAKFGIDADLFRITEVLGDKGSARLVFRIGVVDSDLPPHYGVYDLASGKADLLEDIAGREVFVPHLEGNSPKGTAVVALLQSEVYPYVSDALLLVDLTTSEDPRVIAEAPLGYAYSNTQGLCAGAGLKMQWLSETSIDIGALPIDYFSAENCLQTTEQQETTRTAIIASWQ